MVQATHARKAEFEYEQPVSKIKRVYKKTKYSKKNLIRIFICAFVYAVLIVYLCIKVSTMGYQVVRLEKEIDQLHAANRMLEYKIAEQVSLDKIEMLATTELGMQKLDASQTIAVAYQSNPESKAPETVSKSDTNSKNNGQLSLQKIYSNLMQLAEQR